MKLGRFAVTALLLVACGQLVMAQGTYTQIDVPGALDTECVGVNNAGGIAGIFDNADGNWQGFYLSGQSFTAINYPNALSTFLNAVNDAEQIAGYALMPGSIYVGFTYDVSSSIFTEIQYPGATATLPYAINNAGTVGGAIERGASVLGFELVGASYRRIIPPNESYSGVSGVTATGELLVGASDGNAESNFLFDQGKYQPITIRNLPGAIPIAIDSGGDALAGVYEAGGSQGFLFERRSLQHIQFPNSYGTYIGGVNDELEVVGNFQDKSGHYHGFTWTPPGTDEKN